MTRTWRSLTFLVVLSIACAGAAPLRDPAVDRRDIEARTEQYTAALRANDPASLIALWTDDAVYLDATTPTIVGRAALDTLFRGVFAGARLSSVEVGVEEIVIDRDYAFERLTFREEVQPTGGAPMTLQGRALLVWARGTDGTWRIARGIGTSAAPPAPTQ